MSKEYIEKEALRKLITIALPHKIKTERDNGKVEGLNTAFGFVEMLEPVDVKPVIKARWLDGRCTNCGWECPDYTYFGGYDEGTFSSEEFKYCPKCGAEMTQKVKK